MTDDEYQKINKLSSYAEIESVEAITETYNHRRIDPKRPATGDNVTYDTRTIGWSIRVAGSSAISVGTDKPPAAFKRGARVKVSVELAPYLTGDYVETKKPDGGLIVTEKEA